jgi:hypothetical protein
MMMETTENPKLWLIFYELCVIIKLRDLNQRANYTDRPSDRCLSAKLVSTFEDIECHVVSVTDPYGRILGFLERNRWQCENQFRVNPD